MRPRFADAHGLPAWPCPTRTPSSRWASPTRSSHGPIGDGRGAARRPARRAARHSAWVAPRPPGDARDQADPAPARQPPGRCRMTDDKRRPRLNRRSDEPLVDYPGVHEEVGPPQPLSRRLRDPRTIISLVLPIVLLVLVALSLRELDFDQLVRTILDANPCLLLAAFAIYYLGFPLRGYRWQLAAARRRYHGSACATRPRSSSSAGWSTASCRPSSATSTAPGCCGQLHACRSAGHSARSSSSASSTCSPSRMLGLAAGFWSFRGRPADGGPDRVRRSAWSSWSLLAHRPLHRPQLRPARDQRLPLPAKDSMRRVLRALRGRRLLDRSARRSRRWRSSRR